MLQGAHLVGQVGAVELFRQVPEGVFRQPEIVAQIVRLVALRLSSAAAVSSQIGTRSNRALEPLYPENGSNQTESTTLRQKPQNASGPFGPPGGDCGSSRPPRRISPATRAGDGADDLSHY